MLAYNYIVSEQHSMSVELPLFEVTTIPGCRAVRRPLARGMSTKSPDCEM